MLTSNSCAALLERSSSTSGMGHLSLTHTHTHTHTHALSLSPPYRSLFVGKKTLTSNSCAALLERSSSTSGMGHLSLTHTHTHSLSLSLSPPYRSLFVGKKTLTSNSCAALLERSSSTSGMGRPLGMGMVAITVVLPRATRERTVCTNVLLNISIFPTSSITITGGTAAVCLAQKHRHCHVSHKALVLPPCIKLVTSIENEHGYWLNPSFTDHPQNHRDCHLWCSKAITWAFKN